MITQCVKTAVFSAENMCLLSANVCLYGVRVCFCGGEKQNRTNISNNRSFNKYCLPVKLSTRFVGADQGES